MTRLRRVDLDAVAVWGMWVAVVLGLAGMWVGAR